MAQRRGALRVVSQPSPDYAPAAERDLSILCRWSKRPYSGDTLQDYGFQTTGIAINRKIV